MLEWSSECDRITCISCAPNFMANFCHLIYCLSLFLSTLASRSLLLFCCLSGITLFGFACPCEALSNVINTRPREAKRWNVRTESTIQAVYLLPARNIAGERKHIEVKRGHQLEIHLSIHSFLSSQSSFQSNRTKCIDINAILLHLTTAITIFSWSNPIENEERAFTWNSLIVIIVIAHHSDFISLFWSRFYRFAIC